MRHGNFEYFSEDPYLTGELAVCTYRGTAVGCGCLREAFRGEQSGDTAPMVDVEIDEAALREIYLPAFYEC